MIADMKPAAPALNDDACWAAVVARRTESDGLFVTAVRTTGIYCRPSCPAKTPHRKNVTFYATPRAAASDGYRACKRCRPDTPARPAVALIRDACRRIDAADPTPTLAALAAECGVSPFHLQRTFRRITGVTPRQYAQARRTRALRSRLRDAPGVAAATYDAGFGSSRAVYEQDGARLGMTPGRYRRGGEGMRIAFTVAASPFGRMLVAATDRGVSSIAFDTGDDPLEAALRREYPAADIARDDVAMRPWVEGVLRTVAGEGPDPQLPLDVRATAFRIRVWEALRAIPRGETRSYGEIAASIGAPRAVRAVGTACAVNPVPLIVPCHRAVRGDGTLGGFRYGSEMKRRILASESAEVPSRETRAPKPPAGAQRGPLRGRG